jgi:hypothetical protein
VTHPPRKAGHETEHHHRQIQRDKEHTALNQAQLNPGTRVADLCNVVENGLERFQSWTSPWESVLQ